MWRDKKRVHFIGIGGIGTSGIAQILMAFGCKISGSDVRSSSITEKLEKLGADIFMGHSADNIRDADLVIYTGAVNRDNPELAAATKKGIPVLSRAEALALLANQKKSIAVTGAHGKTSTASLISHMLLKCAFNPTVCVGGEMFSLGGNALMGKDDYFVLEADESDGSFLVFKPLYSVITNIDREHLDYYRDLNQITAAFSQFMNNTREEGTVFFCADDPLLAEVSSDLNRRKISFGWTPEAQIYPENIRIEGGRSRFRCIYQGRELGEIRLNIPGRHNISNALAAAALGLELGLDFNKISSALSSYLGVKRRMERKLEANDILVFEDYAHHPTEIRVTLDALSNFRHKRLIAVFQPHRYTRTKFLLDDFGSCFKKADCLIVTDIYPASEAPIAGVNAERICQKAQEADVADVLFLPRERILEHLLEHTRAGDLVAIMGAGDIGKIADELAEALTHTYTLK